MRVRTSRRATVLLLATVASGLGGLIVVVEFFRPAGDVPGPSAPPAVETAAPPALPLPEPVPIFAEASETVYRTPSGERYHRESCRFVRSGNATALTLAAAKRQRLTPCLVCNPPPLP